MRECRLECSLLSNADKDVADPLEEPGVRRVVAAVGLVLAKSKV